MARVIGEGRLFTYCIILRARGSNSWGDNRTSVDPTQPLNLNLTLAQTATRSQNGPKRARNAAAPHSHRAIKILKCEQRFLSADHAQLSIKTKKKKKHGDRLQIVIATTYSPAQPL